uniref:Secreted protein n=1 Tax=Lepeophtheirus salmonis TaxID=72036 RepID=A0A0K2U880_LEPSM
MSMMLMLRFLRLLACSCAFVKIPRRIEESICRYMRHEEMSIMEVGRITITTEFVMSV